MPFERPAHPGPLVIPPGTTQHAAATLQDLHQEALHVFIKVNAVDKALIQQIIQAIEPEYLSALRDRVTNSINIPVFNVLQHLENSYGNVKAEALQVQDDEVSCMSYSLAQPIYMIFNALDDLADYADLSDSPYTERQIISKALVILNRTQCFQQPILDWKRRPRLQSTWVNFKTFFSRAHKDLRSVNNLTIEAAQHQEERANLVSEVVAGIQNTLPDAFHQPEADQDLNLPPAPDHQPPAPAPAPAPPATDFAFSAAQQMNQQMSQQMQQMQQMQMLLTQLMTTIMGNQGPGNQRNPRSCRTCPTN